jgi:8-oxo-dGTP diphosphatase
MAGRYFIARRLSGGDMGGKWEFPGGKVEAGETCEEALRREYAEELGIKIEVSMQVCEVTFSHDGHDFLLSAYWVAMPEDLRAVKLSEHSEWRWATLDEILALDFADSDRKILRFLI